MDSEPREVFPYVRFHLPRMGSHVRDFRPVVVAADDAFPTHAQPPAPEEVADPKSSSSATGSASQSGSGSSETEMNGQTSSSQGSTENPVGAEKVSPSPEGGSSTPVTSLLSGDSVPPVGPTGPTASITPLQIKTPSFRTEGNGSDQL